MTAIEPGNLMDRGQEEFYYSTPYQLTEKSAIKRVSWKGVVPAGTWVRMQLRFIDTEDKLDHSPWIGIDGENSWFGNGQATHQHGKEWAQYRRPWERNPPLTRLAFTEST